MLCSRDAKLPTRKGSQAGHCATPKAAIYTILLYMEVYYFPVFMWFIRVLIWFIYKYIYNKADIHVDNGSMHLRFNISLVWNYIWFLYSSRSWQRPSLPLFRILTTHTCVFLPFQAMKGWAWEEQEYSTIRVLLVHLLILSPLPPPYLLASSSPLTARDALNAEWGKSYLECAVYLSLSPWFVLYSVLLLIPVCSLIHPFIVWFILSFSKCWLRAFSISGIMLNHRGRVWTKWTGCLPSWSLYSGSEWISGLNSARSFAFYRISLYVQGIVAKLGIFYFFPFYMKNLYNISFCLM